MRSSIRLSILAVALAACTNDSGSGSSPEPAGLLVQGISVPDFGSWESNRPIEFAFDEPIDFASVSARSIHIRTSAGIPAAGTFAARSVDADGDGLPEGTDESVVVFYPSCATAADLSDAGLTPGARYLVTLAGDDSGLDPAALLRSVSGDTLAHTLVRAFETITDPARTLHDQKPGAAPLPLVRAAGASTRRGCHLELGEDPSQAVFFEAGPVSGRPPAGFTAPLNLLGDRATHVAFVVVLDQPIRATPENLARLRLEYDPSPGLAGWVPLETRTELLSNCLPDDVAVRLVPLGAFPPGGSVRAVIDTGFEDLLGEATSGALDEFALTDVATVAFTGLAPAGAVADEIREEFDFGAESPLSFADPVAPPDAGQALWGQGELRANADFVDVPPELREFDWVVRSGDVFVFDTTATVVRGGTPGVFTNQNTVGGFVAVHDLLVEFGGEIRVRGPNPMVVHASGSVTIHGSIDASGFDAKDEFPSFLLSMQGGPGAAGGGAGATSRAGPDARGETGSGAFRAGSGGEGGESCFGPAALSEIARRGGGGGGGRFARDQGPLSAGRGDDGGSGGRGAESGVTPARGGAAGPEVFIDGDPTNDFFGLEPIVDAIGAVVGRRRGELLRIQAGAGGGNGGDSITADAFPPPGSPLVPEGGGGGGGGGALHIRALGRIFFGALGQIRANGGRGGRRVDALAASGAGCGGSGSGGHVILESAEAIVFADGIPGLNRSRVQAVGGPRIVQAPSQRGAGGAGGPGVVQLHVLHPERAPGDAGSSLLLPLDALAEPDPLAAVCEPRPHVLYPSALSLSRALSRWIPLGAAGEGGPGRPASVVGFRFEGLETAPGDDEGKVRTSGGRVSELAPLVGPALLAGPDVELLSDGASLALSGSVLAPLRASAQPISPDVYLRTPALLAGSTLRLANAAEPGRHRELTVAGARYDDAASTLTLVLGGLSGPLAETVAELGGEDEVELALVPRFFRVRLGPSGADVMPDSHFVRVLFQGAADDGTGRADEANPLVDWTADVGAFGALAPGALDFVRFLVEFELDADENGFDPVDDALALEFLRLPLRF